MKVALITDTHYGVRNDSTIFLDYQQKFIHNVFIPYLRANQITEVIHLGDLVDRRKYININTAKRMREEFINPLSFCNTHVICGNHDIYNKNTNEINVFEELFSTSSLIVHTSAKHVKISDNSVLFVPWITVENYQHTMQTIKDSDAQLCFGHLELMGFEMDRGHIMQHGMDRKIFSKFDMTFSGHFHHKSENNNIYYLGAPYQMTWADYGCQRGFHTFDFDTRELQFIPNPYQLFHMIEYDDSTSKTIEQILATVDLSSVSGAYCKIVVKAKNNPYLFDMFVSHIEELSPFDLKIVQQAQINLYNDQMADQCEDTPTLLSRAIEQLEVSVDKNELKKLIDGLYKQAMQLEQA